MITRRFSPVGLLSRAATLNEADFLITTQARQNLIAPGSLSQVTVRDAVLNRQTGATVDQVVDVIPQDIVPGTTQGFRVESATPTVATIGSNGQGMVRVTDGTAILVVRTPRINRRTSVPVSRTMSITDALDHFVDGSLARLSTDAIDSELLPGTELEYHVGESWNQACWAQPFFQALTCVSTTLPHATLITPDYVVGAEHAQFGSTISFRSLDGSLVTRTVVGRLDIGPPNLTDGFDSDITVGRLDTAVPPSISPITFLPSYLLNKFGELQWGVPVLMTDQFHRATVGELYSLTAYNRPNIRAPNGVLRSPFWRDKTPGDSGSPVFLIYENSLRLLTTMTGLTFGAGPAYTRWLTEIGDAIVALGGGSIITVDQLNQFPNW